MKITKETLKKYQLEYNDDKITTLFVLLPIVIIKMFSP